MLESMSKSTYNAQQHNFDTDIQSLISGYDFVLIKLSNEKGGQQDAGKIIPVCLPGKKFPALRNEQVYMAGFGRREIPHCMTDMQGPDKFQVNHTSDIGIVKIQTNRNLYIYIYIVLLLFRFVEEKGGARKTIEGNTVNLIFLA